jgi:peptide/nickel transport system permease protein
MKRKKLAKWVLLGYVLIAVLHPFIANEGNYSFSVFGKEVTLRAPIPYSYSTIDNDASFTPPFQSSHWLGTDIIGRDTFAGILKGTEIAVRVGFFSVFIALLFSLVVGLLVAYIKRFPIKVDFVSLILYFLSIVILIYYVWLGFYSSMAPFFLVFILLLGINMGYHYLSRNKKKKLNLPVDGIYFRIIEAMKAIPGLIFILACVSIFDRFTVNGLILILAFLIWPTLSRYIRAEALKILAQDYITAAKAYGASGFRILYIHVLPKLFTSLSVVLAFAISSAILIESTLSFLGIGIPIEQVSWGSLLKEGQRNFSAWWLAVFPGIALFGLILCLNIIAEKDD